MHEYQYKYKYLSKYAPSDGEMAYLRREKPHSEKIHWGVDANVVTTEELYQCVIEHFGKPAFWGRYLAEIPGIAEPLTKAEVSLLHGKGIKILPIYSAFEKEETRTYKQGVKIANEAISYAEQVGVPKGKIIFGDIEESYPVTAEWIRGFVNTVYAAGYRVGLYHDPIGGAFKFAYCKAAQQDKIVREQTILWANQPQLGIRGKDQLRCFLPARPPCECFGSSFRPKVWAWQYGVDSELCPVGSQHVIDTNLINDKLFQILW
jgi:hypothetical protein